MHRLTEPIALAAVLMCGPCGLASPAADNPVARTMLDLGLRGVHFVPNQGQWRDESVKYGLRSRGVDVAFRESSFTMHLSRRQGQRGQCVVEVDSPERPAPEPESLMLGVSFPGSNQVLPEGGCPRSTRFNYFVGGDGRRAASEVSSFAAVVYRDLYDGVDLHVRGSDGGVLKYEFHVGPGVDYSQIRIAYDGIDSLCVDDAGDLHIATRFGTLMDVAPIVWQDVQGQRRLLDARFELLDPYVYTIRLLKAPDASLPLIVDPELEWMAYLGGGGDESGRAVAVSQSGGAYVAGITSSVDFEGRVNSFHDGSTDAFVLKISPSGELEWMTYLGGSDWDQGHGIALDEEDNALISGDTRSIDFEGRNNQIHRVTDAFVLKVNSSGVLQWMTYLGGSSFDHGWGVAVDGAGDVLVGGSTSSVDFEGRINRNHGRNDVYVLKVSSGGVLQWMTYLGGEAGASIAEGLAVDGEGNALLSGHTSSTEFVGRNNSSHGSADGFVLKVDPAGSLLWMTYLGGIYSDEARGIVVDGAGNSYVTGYTPSPDFEGRINVHYGSADAFAAQVSPDGVLHWMTYLGGSNWDEGDGIALDEDGNLVVAGRTRSVEFDGRINSLHEGIAHDAFAVKVSPDGAAQRMIYLGGSDDEFAYGVAVTPAGRVLVTGSTVSMDFEGRRNAHHGARIDAYLVKTVLESGPLLQVDSNCPSGGAFLVSWRNATAGGEVLLFFSRENGAFRIPQGYPCEGVQLGLGASGLRLVGGKGTDRSGSGLIRGTISSAACGGYLQLLDLTLCGRSNVATIE